uniref:SGNH hydrolase-type esterase domain-containing protein n=1 Tax=Fusarium oxysporum (strain Fo5176) TaxID=660025 RepID=A0A0D2Y6C7_FUSOF
MSYPMIIDRLLGSQVESFQYAACSGDRAGQIYQQAEQIEGDLDMVILTAGGNDLCLSGIISDCILLSAGNDEACEAVLKVAEENVETIIKSNMKEILYALNKKVKEDGIVVVLGYAEFFSTENSDCEDEAWDITEFTEPIKWPQKTTIAHRHRFNALVKKINRATADAVNEISKDDEVKYIIGFSDWNPWVTDASFDGQMYSPFANGDYPSKGQPEMHFIKPPTNPTPGERDELKKRGLDQSDYYDYSRGELKKKRARRHDPKPPGCPSDKKRDWTMGIGLPDKIAENFHPDEHGHVTMASFAMAEAMDLRSLVLGIDAPSCEVKNEFKCWSDDNWKIFSSADRLDEHYEDFCKNIEQPDHEKGWDYYKEDTPDEHEFRISLSDDVADYDVNQCIDSSKKLIHNCDTNRRLNWKTGGKYIRDDGAYTYEVSPTRYNRPWPPPEYAQGTFKGWCFKNNKVVKGAGGWTDGRGGND